VTDVPPQPVGPPVVDEDGTEHVVLAYPEGVELRGYGAFQLDFLLYQWGGMDLRGASNALLGTLELPPKIITPFLVMIVFSLMTRRNRKEALDRYYAKMKTPVDPDPVADERNLEAAYAAPEQFERKKLFPGTDLEFQRPGTTDIVGFVVSVLVCFGIIGIAVWITTIGV
jgi:hypothetical protein